MAANGTTNGHTNGHTNGQAKGSSKFDPNFTQHVIDLMSPETDPRQRVILTSLIRHMHDFCREVELTQDEWVTGVNYINSLGQAYKKNRNETWRVCDILGIESCVFLSRPYFLFRPYFHSLCCFPSASAALGLQTPD